ncbi:MAG: T9SS type A sorting domain-containing protein, partial [Bacteroidota bacterium]|nr:T9SS type A sorting domain-containing protein [Bacteroidota bacterium]
VSTLEDGDYVLDVKDVEDLAGNIMDPASMNFSYVGIDDIVVSNSLNVFPNPAEHMVNIAFNTLKSSEVNLRLLNVLGEEIFNEQKLTRVGDNQVQIDVSGLKTGVYVIHLQSERELIQQKLIVK